MINKAELVAAVTKNSPAQLYSSSEFSIVFKAQGPNERVTVSIYSRGHAYVEASIHNKAGRSMLRAVLNELHRQEGV